MDCSFCPLPLVMVITYHNDSCHRLNPISLCSCYPVLESHVMFCLADIPSHHPHALGVSLGDVDGEEVDLVSVVIGEGCQRATYYAGLGKKQYVAKQWS